MRSLAITSLLASSTLAFPFTLFPRQDPDNIQASDPQTPPTTFPDLPKPANPFANEPQTAPASCTDFQKPSDQCLTDLAAQAPGNVVAFSGGEIKFDNDHQCGDEEGGKKSKYMTALYDAHILGTYAHLLPDDHDAKSIALWKTWIGPNYAAQQQRIYDNLGRASDMVSKKSFDIIVSCKDTKGYCKVKRDNKSVGGYAWTYSGWFGYYYYITMCDPFFSLPTLEEKIVEIENDLAAGKTMTSTEAEWQKNTGQFFLHEMMHLDSVGQPHINDEHVDRDGVGPWAYGPGLVYKLAQRSLDQGGGADRASTNADSYAWFANSKYFYDLTGYFPAPPKYKNAEAIDETDASQAQDVWPMMLDGIDANTSDDDLNGRVTASGADVSAATSDPAPTQPDPAPAPVTDEQIQCNGLGTNKYINVDDLNNLISGFCNDLRTQGVQDKDSGSFERKYNTGTPQEVSLSIDWVPGTTIDMNACETHIRALSDDCDGNDPNNPMNWKAGGTQVIHVGGDATYHITPLAIRPPAPKEVTGKLECNGWFKFWLSGTGWNNEDWGQGMKDNFNGCLGSGYTFDYGMGDDGREWTMTGWYGPFQEDCMHNAVKAVGGPDLYC